MYTLTQVARIRGAVSNPSAVNAVDITGMMGDYNRSPTLSDAPPSVARQFQTKLTLLNK